MKGLVGGDGLLFLPITTSLLHILVYYENFEAARDCVELLTVWRIPASNLLNVINN